MKAVRVWNTLLCICMIGLFLCATRVHASDIAFYIGAWPPSWYDERQFEDVDQIIAETDGLFITTQKFKDGQIKDFEDWVKGNVSDGDLDIIRLNGSMPRFLYPGGAGRVSFARRWVKSGNMFTNVGFHFAFQSFCERGVIAFHVQEHCVSRVCLDGVGAGNVPPDR